MEIEDWRLAIDQINKQKVKNPVKIDEATTTAGNSSNKFIVDTEYVLHDNTGNNNRAENRKKNGETNSDSKLKGSFESKDDTL